MDDHTSPTDGSADRQPRADDHLRLMLARTSRRWPNRPALRELAPGADLPALAAGRGSPAWLTWTYAEFEREVDSVSRALLRHGVARGDRVAIFSSNRPEWSIADYACVGAGAVTVPLYQSSTVEQVEYMLADSGAVLVFVDGASELQRVLQAWPSLPHLRTVVTFTTVAEKAVGAAPRGWLTWADLQASSPDPGSEQELVERHTQASPSDLATIIYTSGTTGPPKGVMLTHAAMVHQLRAIDAFFDVTEHDSSLCFLPLSHALERAWSTFIVYKGALNTYLRDPKAVADMMRVTTPTLLVSVPRLYETVYARAHAQAGERGVKRRIFDAAFAIGRAAGERRLRGEPLPRYLAQALKVADRLVLHNVRDAIGGPKAVLASGGGPLRREVEEFFWAAGQLVSQGYGLTEAAPLVSFNCPGAFRFGTVGLPIVGSEVAIVPLPAADGRPAVEEARDGEIVYRGPNVMAGYWNDDKASAETVVDGWLQTGDIGHLDEDGFIVITDRLKDLIVTLQGKNIAPGPIESLITADPLIEQVVVIGDDRPCLVALVSVSAEALEAWRSSAGVSEADSPAVLAELQQRMSAALKALPRHEQIRGVRVLPEAPSVENGLLTPTLKVRRRAITARYPALVDDLYAELAAARVGGSGAGA